MTYKYGKFASGAAYRYARGAPREYACGQCGAWHLSALTVCYECCRANSSKEQAEVLAKEKTSRPPLPDSPAAFYTGVDSVEVDE